MNLHTFPFIPQVTFERLRTSLRVEIMTFAEQAHPFFLCSAPCDPIRNTDDIEKRSGRLHAEF
jgi:hypothetical protein